MKNITQLAKEHGLNPGTLYDRLYRGWTLDDALIAPVSPNTRGKRSKCTVCPAPTDINSDTLCKRLDASQRTLRSIATNADIPLATITQGHNTGDFSMLTQDKKVALYMAAGGGV